MTSVKLENATTRNLGETGFVVKFLEFGGFSLLDNPCLTTKALPTERFETNAAVGSEAGKVS